MVNVLKILNAFLFSNKMSVFRTGIHKLLVRLANREDPDQTASDLGLHWWSWSFWQATSDQNFRTFTIHITSRKYTEGKKFSNILWGFTV